MAAQYDNIQGPFDYTRMSSRALIERENVQTILTPFLENANAKVLELACGSGFYTHRLLEWGAGSLVAVDVSPVMLEEARRQGNLLNDEISRNKPIRFLEADCSIPAPYYLEDHQNDGRPFDLVFAAWLLNYAPDRASLVNMFRNIAINLKEGGYFVGVTVPPSHDPIALVKNTSAARPPPAGSGTFNFAVNNEVEDGIFLRVYGFTPAGDYHFDCYFLKRDLYESAAREAGLKGNFEWHLSTVPDRYLRGEGEGGASIEELQSYTTLPGCGILVIGK